MLCAEYVAYTQKHFRNNYRPLSRMYLEKHQIEVTIPRFSSLYYKPSSKYMLNQIAEMLGMLKKINTARVIRICLSQSKGIREPTPLSWHSKTPIRIPFVARHSLTCIYRVSLTHVHVCICDSWVDPKFKYSTAPSPQAENIDVCINMAPSMLTDNKKRSKKKLAIVLCPVIIMLVESRFIFICNNPPSTPPLLIRTIRTKTNSLIIMNIVGAHWNYYSSWIVEYGEIYEVRAFFQGADSGEA